MKKILLVEDEKGIRELIHLYLVNRGYTSIQAENGHKAMQLLHSEDPHLVLLDIEIPDINGFDVCQEIRKYSDVPIIFVSSHRDLMNKLKGFQIGGDDYITKPFDFAELEARVRTNLQRYQRLNKYNKGTLLTYGNLEIYVDTYECYVNGEKVPLSTKEIQMLILLAQRPNQVFSAEQIYDQIWGLDSIGDSQTVKVHIRNLRSKIEKDTTNPAYILTVRGFGYRFAN